MSITCKTQLIAQTAAVTLTGCALTPAVVLSAVSFSYDVCGNDNAYRLSTLEASGTHQRAPSPATMVGDPVVCVPTVLSEDYLSSSVVQKAIHVERAKLSQWGECYDIDYRSNLVSLLPLYPKLISHMNVLIYSGDADACVPWNGSYNWTRNLGLQETQAWRPWTTSGEGRSWVGGFVTAWGANFSFVTIKHAGQRSCSLVALALSWSLFSPYLTPLTAVLRSV